MAARPSSCKVISDRFFSTHLYRFYGCSVQANAAACGRQSGAWHFRGIQGAGSRPAGALATQRSKATPGTRKAPHSGCVLTPQDIGGSDLPAGAAGNRELQRSGLSEWGRVVRAPGGKSCSRGRCWEASELAARRGLLAVASRAGRAGRTACRPGRRNPTRIGRRRAAMRAAADEVT